MRTLPEGLEEASGLTAGPDDGLLSVDDATGTGDVVAVDTAGRLVARTRVAGMSADNAEAPATGPCGDGSDGRCLYVGDIGGNHGREEVVLYRAPLPDGPPWSAAAAARTYRYPDGPHNAESMFVTADGSVVIVSKPGRGDTGTVALHQVFRGGPDAGDLHQVGSFTPPAPENPLQSLSAGTVATDAAWDGRRVLLLTYDQVIEYTAPSPDSDPAEFFRWPHRELPMPTVIQAEGITSLPDRCGYARVSEEGPGGSAGNLSVRPCS